MTTFERCGNDTHVTRCTCYCRSDFIGLSDVTKVFGRGQIKTAFKGRHLSVLRVIIRLSCADYRSSLRRKREREKKLSGERGKELRQTSSKLSDLLYNAP